VTGQCNSVQSLKKSSSPKMLPSPRTIRQNHVRPLIRGLERRKQSYYSLDRFTIRSMLESRRMPKCNR
jgi:hypothetical protein